MLYRTHIPGPPLADFVDWFWFYADLTPPHRLERVLPDGSMELIFNLRDEARHVFDPVQYRPTRDYRRSWFSGAHSRFIVIDTAPDSSMIGVHFKPGGAAAILGVPASALRNAVVDLEALWDAEAVRVREQLLQAPSPDAMFRALEAALLRRLRHPTCPAVAYALKRFTQAPDDLTVAQVADEIGFSRRHFIAQFTGQVGLTPKRFCRVRRFQRALGEVQKRRPLAWASIANSCGYYDQAHFIHDFQEFCGMAPTRFAEQGMEYPNFVPIVA
jgi:AraC-like DNA-binding protein